MLFRKATAPHFVLVGWLVLAPLGASADDGAHDAHPRPSPLWLALQLVPSVEVAAGEAGAAFGLRWQVTPFLYSWGINQRLSPFRAFVVEPLVRHSGSVELFAAPGLSIGDAVEATLRAGARTYLPLIEHGETLSMSVGVAYQRAGPEDAVAFELGLYTLYGLVGLQLSVAGPDSRLPFIASLSLRAF